MASPGRDRDSRAAGERTDASEVTAKVAGAVAAAIALVIAHLVHAIWRSVPSLVATVGQEVIRLSPGGVSRTGIDAVGTADKPLLLAAIVLLCLAIGWAVGPVAVRRPWAGDATFAAAGVAGVAAAAALPGASAAAALAGAAAGVVAGVVTLRALLAAATADVTGPRLPGSVVGRRRFLLATGTAVGGGAIVLSAGVALDRRGDGGPAVVLPPPADPAAPLPASAFDTAGLSPLVTPNRDFYRIDEALVVPQVDRASWRLRVGGMVGAPFELTYDELLAEPLVEADITMACVSNEVGDRLVGNARWTGVRLADLLHRASPETGAEQVVGRSVDGFTTGFPLAVALDGRDALVAVAMNGEPLPRAHGFPARLVVPGLYGYVSATKWLTAIELTSWDAFDAYWVERGWAKEAPIKVQSRIDVPRDGSRRPAGRLAVAGVAWAPHRGVGGVEVRIDGGPWQPATLGPSLGDDSWRQWQLEWPAPAGPHEIEVRATTADGQVQDDQHRPPFPDGATGHHRVRVVVT